MKMIEAEQEKFNLLKAHELMTHEDLQTRLIEAYNLLLRSKQFIDDCFLCSSGCPNQSYKLQLSRDLYCFLSAI